MVDNKSSARSPDESNITDNDVGVIFGQENKSRFHTTSSSSISSIHRKMMLKILKFHELVNDKNKKIIDVGCGYGTSLKYFHSLGYKNIYGIDPDNDLIKTIPKEIAEVKSGMAQKIPYPDESFDVVFVNGALHHIPIRKVTYKEAIKEMDRVLKPGGHVFFMEPGRYWAQIFCELGAIILGVVSKTFKDWADAIYVERAEIHYFIKNHPIFRNDFKERNYNVLSDTYFIFSWLYSAQKPRRLG